MSTITELPSGKWRAQVRRKGVYKAATFTKKSAAVKWASEAEEQAESAGRRGLLPVPKDAKLSDLIAKYLKDTKPTGKTKLATLAMLNRELGGVHLERLGAVHLRDFIDKRQDAGAGGVTIAADLSYLSTVLKWAKDVRQLDLDPEIAQNARKSLMARKLSTRSDEREREPTEEELAKLYAHWAAKDRQLIPMQTICEFALATAMRLGEICNLQTADIKVDIDNPTVIIRDRKDPKKKQGNDQHVPLLPAAWAIVQPRMGEHPTLLFPYSARSVSTSFTRACKSLGIEDLHFHDLRHCATAALFRQGLGIPEVSILTGHKTWSMLRRYTKITAADVLAKFKEAAR